MAIDEHRPFKSCVFCGNPKKAELTKEHIFGKKVARRFPVKHNWKTAKDTIFGPLVTKGGGPIVSATAKLACGDCNSGPLSDIMDASLEPLMKLIEGKQHQITPKDRVAVSRYWERVGLIVDVMTSNCQLDSPNPDRLAPPRYSNAQRRAWRDGGTLFDIHVQIGSHDGVLGLNPYTNVVHGLEMGAARQLRMSQQFLMTIGKLSVHISMVEHPRPLPNSFRNLDIGHDWSWPGTVPPVSYEDFLGLCYQDPLHIAILQLMSNPEHRQRVEAYSRQEKSFTCPPELEALFRELKRAAAAWSVR